MKPKRHPSFKLPLQIVLVLPFLLQMIVVVGLTAYFTYRNGQHAVSDLALRLGNEVAGRVNQKLETYLNAPLLINQINADVIRLGELKLPDQTAERYLWQQIHQFPSVSEIYLGTEQGEFVGVEFKPEHQIVIEVANQQTNGEIQTYQAGTHGQRQTLLETLPNYDPRHRPWYRQAIQFRKPIWSDVFLSFTDQQPCIAASQPLYNAQGKLIGVAGATVSLAQLSRFLGSLQVSPNAQTFIISADGELVATSSPSQGREQTEPQRAIHSSNALTQASFKFLTNQITNLKTLHQPRYLEFTFNDQRQHLLVVPFADQPNLDWLIAVVVPEADFMSEIHANTQNTALLCLVALVIATGLGIFTSRWISQPILSLSKASQTIAKGASSACDLAILEHNKQTQRIVELDVLAQSFQQMAQQLRVAFFNLEQANTQLEQRVERRTNALRQAEAELRGLLAAMKELILVFDASAHLVKIVQTSSSLPDKPTEEAIGQPLAAVFPTAQTDELKVAIQQALGIQQTHIVEYCHQIGKQEIWCSASISPISDQKVILVARDITEDYQAAAELQENLDKEKQLNELKSRFVSMTSHEFRTPLTTILSSVELLESRSHKWAEARDLKHLDRIQAAVKRMTQLMNDVLVVSKADANRIEFCPAPMDIENYCHNLVEEVQQSSGQQYQVLFEAIGDCSQVWVDENLLQHILPNLLSNALKYSPQGGLVFLRLTCEPEQLTLQVQDQGIGIPRADLPHLFDSFHRAKNVGNISGTGLGLAIVKKSVDLHGGRISVESEVGQGTIFTVVLPTHEAT